MKRTELSSLGSVATNYPTLLNNENRARQRGPSHHIYKGIVLVVASYFHQLTELVNCLVRLFPL